MTSIILTKKKVGYSMNRRINLIVKHPEYVKCQDIINTYENDRLFCKHDIFHALDVARIFYLQVLEQGVKIKKDIVYAVALLHDIGRADEYKDSIPHHLASVNISKAILGDCDYRPDEIKLIADIISKHRETLEASPINLLFFESDKMSRLCFQCSSSQQCKWEQDRKNTIITY